MELDSLKETISRQKMYIKYQREQNLNAYQSGLIPLVSYNFVEQKLDILESFYEAYLNGELSPIDRHPN